MIHDMGTSSVVYWGGIWNLLEDVVGEEALQDSKREKERFFYQRMRIRSHSQVRVSFEVRKVDVRLSIN